MKYVRFAAIGAVALTLGGCASPAYYLQAIDGQIELWRRARPLPQARNDPTLSDDLHRRLDKAAELRDFASRELGLPNNGTFRSYADLQRPYVVWNVFAAETLSAEAKQWCFPVAGCVAYRGYFSEAAAQSFAAELRREGYDVYVAGVPAYSTLGWFDDPILNTFITYPEAELGRLIFHELAHQVVYVRDDTEFNESFAVSVEEAGVARWLTAHGTAAQLAETERMQARKADFRELIRHHRQRLAEAYAALTAREEKLAAKAHILADLRTEYLALRNGPWQGYAGYDRWFAQKPNNAQLASVAIYTQRVPAFEALLQRD